MRQNWDLKPDLLECILEDRIVPAPLNNLGMIVQTTGGLALVTPFPGAINMAAMAGGGTGNSAPSVSGAAWPTGIYVTGSRGISAMMPGNFTGNAAISLGSTMGSSGGVSMTIKVGSGADEAGGPVSTTRASSRTNPAYGGDMPNVMSYIGRVSGDTELVSNPNAPNPTAPVPSLPPMGISIPGSPAGASPGSNPTMNPQMGAPQLMRGLGSGLVPSLPGGLGVGSLNAPNAGGR